MSESGPDSGAADNNRRSDRAAGLPPSPPEDQDDDQWTTTALPRPTSPPQGQPPVDRFAPSGTQATTALPRTPPPAGRYPPTPQSSGFALGYRDSGSFDTGSRTAGGNGPGPAASGQSGAGYSGAVPSGAGDHGYQRLEPRFQQPPVGPSWAPQHPYQAPPAQQFRPAPPPPPAHPPGPTDEQHPNQRGRATDRPSDRPAQEQHQPPAGSHPYVPRPDHERRDRQQPDQQRYEQQRPDPRGYDPRDDAPRDDAPRGYERRDDAPRGYEPRRYEPPQYEPHEYEPRGYEPHDDARLEPDYPDNDDLEPRDRARPDYPRPDRPGADHPRSDRSRADDFDDREFDEPARRPPPRGSHLPPYSEPMAGTAAARPTTSGMRSPRKLTVTRVAALRSRELTSRGVQMFHRATTADGADKSGLTSLTYAVMANYAADAAMAVALAGTLFFAAATAESTGRVLLYLVITVAPFAVIAPFIGPMLDRLQSGRRLALALSSFGRALLAVLMAFNFAHFNPWVIYPCALGNLVLSKAFGVLKAALTPRVLPEKITLVKTNSRLTTFGMIAGGVAGVVAAGLSKLTGSPGALFFTAACAIAGGVLCLRIPAWVESTEGEVPVKEVGSGKPTKGFPRIVTATLWANSMIRVETGFLALFIAFVVKSQYPAPQHSAFTQLLLLGVVGGAAGIGGFVGNTMGARLTLSAPETISIIALIGVLASTVIAVLVPGLATAALVGFVGSTASALAKVSLDSVIQHHLPEESRASGFGISESVLQLGWVFGGVVGLLLGGVWTFGHVNVYAIGFGTITLLLVIGLVQSYLVRSGRTMVPKLGLRSGGSAGRTARRKKGDGVDENGRVSDDGRGPGHHGRGDTDRLTRPAPAATAHLPTAQLPTDQPEKTRRRPRKAGGDR